MPEGVLFVESVTTVGTNTILRGWQLPLDRARERVDLKKRVADALAAWRTDFREECQSTDEDDTTRAHSAYKRRVTPVEESLRANQGFGRPRKIVVPIGDYQVGQYYVL